MEIFVRCTISEELLQEGLKKLNCEEWEFIEKVSHMLSDDVIETLDDNRELFSEINFSINEPLF